MGNHESSAGVVTDETTAGQVTLNLQGKQIPAEKNKQQRRKDGKIVSGFLKKKI